MSTRREYDAAAPYVVIVYRDGRRRSDAECAVVPDPAAALDLTRRAQARGLRGEVHAALPPELAREETEAA